MSVDKKTRFKILRITDVTEKVGIPISTLYWMIANSDFPKSIKLSERSVGWIEADIDNWIEKKIMEAENNGVI